MKTAQRTPQTALRRLLVPLLTLLVVSSAFAQEAAFTRKSTNPELFASGTWFRDSGNTGDVFSGGFGVGYNVTDMWAYSIEMMVGSVQPRDNSGSGTMFTGLFNLECDLLKSRFTPLIIAGIGGAGQTDEGAGSARFLYGGGAGVRYDINQRVFVKALYRVFGVADGDGFLHGATISIGLKF